MKTSKKQTNILSIENWLLQVFIIRTIYMHARVASQYSVYMHTANCFIMVTSPIMNLGYCSSVRRLSLSSLPAGGKPQFLQIANRELNTLSLEPVFSGPQQVVNAAARMQLAITVSMQGKEWSLASHDSCLNFRLQGNRNKYPHANTIYMYET